MSDTAPTELPLAERADALRRAAAERVPGRLAPLIEQRVALLLGIDEGALPPDLDTGEQACIDVVEQFVIDAHGISDAQIDRLGTFYAAPDVVAIMFHLALVDGFLKLVKLDLEIPFGRQPGTDPSLG